MFICQRGESSYVRAYISFQVSVFGDSCQRGRKYWPKAKGPHHHPNFKMIFKLINFKLVSLYVLKGEQVVFSKLDILKPSWTLRGEFIWGGVLFSQRKSIWNKERESQILKMLLKFYSFTFDYLAKGLWKEFTKEFAKTKHVVQAWSNILKIKKQSMHIL
jgi:hypothetical protein